jgi:thiol-disulfide isomerase/thioredoxin
MSAISRRVSLWSLTRPWTWASRGRRILLAAVALAGALTLVCALSAPPAWAEASGAPQKAPAPASATETTWTENSALMARMLDSGAQAGSSSSGTSLGSGEVFDSADYQRMLVLPSQGECAYILELASGKATAYPRGAVLGEGGEVRTPPEESAVAAGTANADEEGRLVIAHNGLKILIEPAPPLVGFIDRTELEARHPAYARHTRTYVPDSTMVAILAAQTQPLQILAFFGSWCSTCKHLLPALLATLDAAHNPAISLICIGVDEDLKQPEEEIAAYEIDATPTFIVLAEGVELGRIEDEPRTSVEADLGNILLLAGGGQ